MLDFIIYLGLRLGILMTFYHVMRNEGGNRPSNSRMFEFKNCLNACSMIDLGFAGPKFTWSNCHDVSSLIMERLDKALGNPDEDSVS